MSEVYVIRNQLGHYWGKSREWQDGHDPRRVQRDTHRDVMLNTLVELNARDIELRGEILSVPVDQRGEPVIEPSPTPLPQADNDEETGEAATDAA
jgi:hypothetical protein